MKYIKWTITCPKFVSQDNTPHCFIQDTPYFDTEQKRDKYLELLGELVFCFGCNKLYPIKNFKLTAHQSKTLDEINKAYE